MFHLHTNYADWVAQFVENKTSKRYWCRSAFQPGKPNFSVLNLSPPQRLPLDIPIEK